MLNNESNLDQMNLNQNDPYLLSSSDHPGMALTNNKFNGSNYLGWCRTVKMALGAKQKLGFIDRTCPKPLKMSPDYQKWVRCDYMVNCWILNSLSTELSEAFLYAETAADLWDEIHQRYGCVNGPQVYQVQKELNEISQGELTVAAYFTRLKKCWDELSAFDGDLFCTCGQMENCSCGLMAKMAEIENRNRLMQFLLKLRNEFDGATSQILSMDPLPSVNRAYYLIQQVEAQQSVTRKAIETSAFMAATSNQRRPFVNRKNLLEAEALRKDSVLVVKVMGTIMTNALRE